MAVQINPFFFFYAFIFQIIGKFIQPEVLSLIDVLERWFVHQGRPLQSLQTGCMFFRKVIFGTNCDIAVIYFICYNNLHLMCGTFIIITIKIFMNIYIDNVLLSITEIYIFLILCSFSFCIFTRVHHFIINPYIQKFITAILFLIFNSCVNFYMLITSRI